MENKKIQPEIPLCDSNSMCIVSRALVGADRVCRVWGSPWLRGLNITYYKDPDIKPKTSLTSQQLMKFAWQIADGMSYLSLRKASISLRAESLTKKIRCFCLMACNSLLQAANFNPLTAE